jgi:hypothetical protein
MVGSTRIRNDLASRIRIIWDSQHCSKSNCGYTTGITALYRRTDNEKKTGTDKKFNKNTKKLLEVED